jgi:hypothetical protein
LSKPWKVTACVATATNKSLRTTQEAYLTMAVC